MIGRRRAFTIGCVIYGIGSLTTALAPNLAVLILGWSVLEGIGAALILPAIVALVAGNFPPEARPRAYGLVMGAGAIAVAVGPLIGGFATTYFPALIDLPYLVARGAALAPRASTLRNTVRAMAASAASPHAARSTRAGSPSRWPAEEVDIRPSTPPFRCAVRQRTGSGRGRSRRDPGRARHQPAGAGRRAPISAGGARADRTGRVVRRPPGARPPTARGGRRSTERDRAPGRAERGTDRHRVTDPAEPQLPGRRAGTRGHSADRWAGGMAIIVPQSRRSRRRAVRLAVRLATLRDPNMATSSSSVLIVRVRSTRTPSRDRATPRPPRP